MIQINSIVVPLRFVRLCTDWAGGTDCMLRAVCSTGGLATGTICPVDDYTDNDDKMRKWYFSIWQDLLYDVGYAACAARKAASDYNDCDPIDEESYQQACEDCWDLEEFQEWVEIQVDRLSESYGLDGWQ